MSSLDLTRRGVRGSPSVIIHPQVGLRQAGRALQNGNALALHNNFGVAAHFGEYRGDVAAKYGLVHGNAQTVFAWVKVGDHGGSFHQRVAVRPDHPHLIRAGATGHNITGTANQRVIARTTFERVRGIIKVAADVCEPSTFVQVTDIVTSNEIIAIPADHACGSQVAPNDIIPCAAIEEFYARSSITVVDELIHPGAAIKYVCAISAHDGRLAILTRAAHIDQIISSAATQKSRGIRACG